MGILPDWAIKRDVKIEPFTDTQVEKGILSYGLGSYGYDMRIGYKFKIFTPTYSTVVDPKDFNSQSFMERDLTPGRHDWHPWTHNAQGNWWKCSLCNCGVITEKMAQFPPCHGKPPNFVTVPPNSFALGESVETFTIPRDCLCIVLGKSSYARVGIIVNVTPGEPEWTGKWTIEVSNSTPLPVKIYAGEGIAQAIFFRTDGYNEALLNNIPHTQEMNDALQRATCFTSYADKKGKYQGQDGLTLPFVKKEE